MNRSAIIAIVAAGVIALAAVGYFALRTTPEPGPPPITGPERAEDARVLIDQFERAPAPDYDAAFTNAQRFQRDGQLADAQLLYFFAARAGHAESAFALATMNDPQHHSPGTSLLPEPDAFQAYRWYTTAHDQGLEAAQARLDALRDWAQRAAAAGDSEAERLLLQWR